jgi:hypothetical protein
MQFDKSTPGAMRIWFEQQIAKISEAGRDTKPWLALTGDERMRHVWELTADWPPQAIESLISFAAALAEAGVPAVLAEPPQNRVGLAWSQHCISEAARSLITELRTDPDTAARLLDAPIEPLISQLEDLFDRALGEAVLIEGIAKQFTPGVAVHVSYDRRPLAYREAIANVVIGLRREGLAVTLGEQDKLVATLANLALCLPSNGEVSAKSEERRRQRKR